MDKLNNKSGNGRSEHFAVHLAPLPRELPTERAVQTLGYIPEKYDWVSSTFQTFNFSVILSGKGGYHWQGQWHPVRAPCVLLQIPGLRAHYGPDPVWEELFFLYKPETQQVWRQAGLVQGEYPFWSFQYHSRMEGLVEALFDLVRHLHRPYASAQIDRMAEMLLMETRSIQPAPEQTSEEQAVRRCIEAIRSKPQQGVDFGRMAKACGMHPATFRRYWAKQVSIPPHQFLLQMRLEQACRMLVESAEPISDIARDCGFEDPLYFSRRFRKFAGQSPRTYRQQHRFLQVP